MTKAHDAAIAHQWMALRDWMDMPDVAAAFDAPSVLDGWTVRDLIAHLGRSFATMESLEEATDLAPQSLLEYVSSYAGAASEIADGTRELAGRLGDDLLSGIDRLAEAGLGALTVVDSPVVIGPRGPIERDDFVVTRLLELVVHADDLARSLPHVDGPPILENALSTVIEALGRAYRERTSTDPHLLRPLDWLREATGRHQSDDPALPLL